MKSVIAGFIFVTATLAACKGKGDQYGDKKGSGTAVGSGSGNVAAPGSGGEDDGKPIDALATERDAFRPLGRIGEDDDDGKPISAMAALDRQIDSGKMTSGEAIVAALQTIIGERTQKEVFGQDAPPLREGTGIIRRAKAYLKTGPDEKHKAEIRRILNIIVPPRGELERRSVPEKSLKRRPTVH